MKSSPWVRVGMAAGMYLLLMWGYVVLPTAQWFAAFLALITSTMVVFWVSEANAETRSLLEQKPCIQEPDEVLITDQMGGATSLEASILRLDSLKSELTLQYAQFGRDQSLINSNGLGSWHGNRNHRER